MLVGSDIANSLIGVGHPAMPDPALCVPRNAYQKPRVPVDVSSLHHRRAYILISVKAKPYTEDCFVSEKLIFQGIVGVSVPLRVTC